MRQKAITLGILAILAGGTITAAFLTPYYWVVALVAIVAVLAFRNELPRGHAWVIALVLLCLMVFGRTVNHQFIIWDDDKNIFDNPGIVDATPSNLIDFWHGPHIGLYIPVTYNVWGVLSMASGTEMNPEASNHPVVSPKLYHLSNIVIHCGSVLLLILILYQLLGRRDMFAAVAGAAFFAIHPLQVEPVAWATGMKDVLSTFLALICFFLYIKHSRAWKANALDKAVALYLTTILIYLVALLTKPAVVVLPPMLFLIDVFILNAKWKPGAFRVKWQPLLLVSLLVINVAAWTLVLILGRSSGELPANLLYVRIALIASFLTITLLGVLWRNPALLVSAVGALNIGLWFEIFYENYHHTPTAVFSAFGSFLAGHEAGVPFISGIWLVTAALFSIASLVAVFVFWPHIGESAITRIIPFFTIAIFFVLQTTISQSKPDDIFPFTPPGLGGRIIVALDSLGFYISKFFYPLGLATEYGRNPDYALNLNSLYPVFLIPILLGIIILCIRNQRNFYLVGFAIALFAVAPVLGIVPFAFQGQSTVADRYVYISMIGISLAVATWLTNTQKTGPRLFTCIAIILLTALSSLQSARWQNSVTLYLHGAKVNPKSVAATYNLGLAYSHAGKPQKALKYYQQTIKLKPDFSRPYNNIGYLLNMDNQFEKAIPYFQKAIELKPEYPGSHSNLGIALDNLGRHQEAIDSYTDGLDRKPDASDILVNLGVALLNVERWDDAIKCYTRAIEIAPEMPQAYVGMGLVYVKTGQPEKAIPLLETLTKIQPAVSAFDRLSEAYQKAGRLPDAIKALQDGLQFATQTPGTPPEHIQQLQTKIDLLKDSLNP